MTAGRALRLLRALTGVVAFSCSLAPHLRAAETKPQPSVVNAPVVTTKPAEIDRNSVIILIRSALLAVHQANLTGNYTVLRDLGAPGFRAANTDARLAEIFANLRNKAFDLSGVLVLDPQLTTLPELNAAGYMHMAGYFPSVPLQVLFDLIYAPVDGRWQLYGISVNVGQSGPSAPAAAAPSSASPTAGSSGKPTDAPAAKK